jgi:hypothetical protein
MKPTRASIIAYFLSIFTLPKVKEEVARLAGMFKGEASRFSTGMKGEVVETRESFVILTKYLKKEKLTRTEKKRFKLHMISMLKGAGVMVPVMLIPLPFVSTLLLIIMDHLLRSMHIQILPASFYPAENKDVLTEEGIRKELKAKVLGRKNN